MAAFAKREAVQKICTERKESYVLAICEDMWCDILTKPKQGKSFRIDRSKLMGCDVDWDEQNIAPQIQLEA